MNFRPGAGTGPPAAAVQPTALTTHGFPALCLEP